MTPSQCRAARALLSWSQRKLADEAAVGFLTVRDFEKGRHEPYARNLDAMREVMERAGVSFIPENGGGPGVRMAEASKD